MPWFFCQPLGTLSLSHPSSLSVQFSLDVVSVPDLGPSSVFNDPFKSTVLVSICFQLYHSCVSSSCLVSFGSLCNSKRAHYSHAFGTLIIFFFLSSWANDLCNHFPRIFSERKSMITSIISTTNIARLSKICAYFCLILSSFIHFSFILLHGIC